VLKRALAICITGLLLSFGPALAEDDSDNLDDIFLGPAEEEEDTGPDYAREGFYVQAGLTYGIASKLEDKLNGNRDKARLAPTQDSQFQRSPVRPIADDGTIILLAVPGMPLNGVRNASGDCEYEFQPGGPPVDRPCELGKAKVSNSIGGNFRIGSRVLPNFAIEMQLEFMSDFETKIPGYSQAAPQSVPAPVFPIQPCPGNPSPGPCSRPTQLLEPASFVRASDTDKINVDLLTLTVNLKVPLLTGRVQPYALLGGGVGFVFRDNKFPRRQILPSPVSSNPTRFEEYVDVQDTGAILRLGAGVDTYVTEHIYLSTEFAYVASQGEAFNDLRYWGVQAGVGYRF
jgi:opacity protein-like surface antigen